MMCNKHFLGDPHKFNKARLRVVNTEDDLAFEPTNSGKTLALDKVWQSINYGGAEALVWVCGVHAMVSIIYRYAIADEEVRQEMCSVYRAAPHLFSAEWKVLFDATYPINMMAVKDETEAAGGVSG